MLKVVNSEIQNKIVLLRVDYNVQIRNGKIMNDFRIKTSLDTIEFLLNNHNKVIIVSHLGRPKGKPVKEYSLVPIKEYLSKLVAYPIEFITEIKDKTFFENHEKRLFMLENVRFWPGEEENDPEFCEKLSNMADVFVFDAFSVAHRKHASTFGIIDFLPSYAGLWIKKEVETLQLLLREPKRPFLVIIGGAKLSTKLGVIKKLISIVDKVFVSGAMAFTFLKALDYDIGQSLYEAEFVTQARELYGSGKIILPRDFKCLYKNEVKICDFDGIIGQARDIGPKTLEFLKQEIKKYNQILWNGPMGKFEEDEFSQGTFELAKMIASKKTIAGGGETLIAIERLGLMYEYGFVSTGGGALLKFLEQGSLPVIDKLQI